MFLVWFHSDFLLGGGTKLEQIEKSLILKDRSHLTRRKEGSSHWFWKFKFKIHREIKKTSFILINFVFRCVLLSSDLYGVICSKSFEFWLLCMQKKQEIRIFFKMKILRLAWIGFLKFFVIFILFLKFGNTGVNTWWPKTRWSETKISSSLVPKGLSPDSLSVNLSSTAIHSVPLGMPSGPEEWTDLWAHALREKKKQMR